MSTELFGFSVSGPDLDEWPVYEGTLQIGDDGARAARVFSPSGRFRSRGGALFFPNASGLSVADLLDFCNDRQGFLDSFLYESAVPALREVSDDARGTHAGGAGVDFLARHKFLDASTLVVKVAGVVQAGGGADYTFSGNNTAPKITTTASFDVGAVTFSYRFRHQVAFTLDPFAGSRVLVPGASLSSPGTHRLPFAVDEIVAGGSLA